MIAQRVEPHLDISTRIAVRILLAKQSVHAVDESGTRLNQHPAIGLALVHPALDLRGLAARDDGEIVHGLDLFDRRAQVQQAVADERHDQHQQREQPDDAGLAQRTVETADLAVEIVGRTAQSQQQVEQTAGDEDEHQALEQFKARQCLRIVYGKTEEMRGNEYPQRGQQRVGKCETERPGAFQTGTHFLQAHVLLPSRCTCRPRYPCCYCVLSGLAIRPDYPHLPNQRKRCIRSAARARFLR